MRRFRCLGSATSIITLCLVGCGRDAGGNKAVTTPELQRHRDEEPYAMSFPWCTLGAPADSMGQTYSTPFRKWFHSI